ncbi:MAG: PIN domain-containing protein [Deferrisomatales bacterium]
MSRVFLDANVLFSAAYRQGSPLARLWALEGVVLVTSAHALEEARRNLGDAAQRDRLAELARRLEVVETPSGPLELPDGVDLPLKDQVILAAAIAAKVNHLLTGDRRHFGPLYGSAPGGVRVTKPSEYLAGR